MNREPAARVAILARSVYPLHRFGGLERHVFDLIANLLDRGLAVTLIAPPRAASRPDDAEADKVLSGQRFSFVPVPYRTFPFANRRGTTILDRSLAYPVFGRRAGRVAAALAARGDVDLIHGFGASALGYALANREMTRAPLVFNPQGLEEFGATDPSRAPLKRIGYAPLRAAVRRCARAADRVIATDRALVEPVLTHLRVPRSAVRVVPNAIEIGDFDVAAAAGHGAELRRRLGLAPDDPLLLSVGRLETNKGFAVLARALSAMSRNGRMPDRWRWVLVGDGPQRDVLRREIEAAGLSRQTTMWGRAVDGDLRGLYAAATLFVHPTLYEGSSLVTLEAMACQRPVVATRAGGLPDKVFPGINGWLVEPGDEAALARAIEEALANPARLRAMGVEGRRIVEREFSWQAATDRLLDVYRELLPASRSL